MPKDQTVSQKIKEILELARFAPSVHNTQPWKVTFTDDTITVNLDPEHLLKDGDPTGRETIISLGIFAESIVLAAKSTGFNAKSVNYNSLSATITLTPGNIEDSGDGIQLLKDRCTDRSIYEKCDIDPQMIDSILRVSQEKEVKVWVINDDAKIKLTAQLTSQGIGVALSSPNFRKELSNYLTLPWSKKDRGISVNSLYIPRLVANFEPLLMRFGIGLHAEVALEKKRWLSSSGIIFIATRGDMPDYWFKAGRDYLRLSLQIEKLGLSQATSAATVEASSFHEDIEEMLGTDYRLQSVIRIGKGKKHRSHSPRVDVDTLLAT